MKTCITCGMPFEGSHANDIGLEISDGPVCKFDSENGHMKSPDEIFNGGVQFFLSVIGDNKSLAEKLVRKNMNTLPYWQAHPFDLLKGDQATDEEFAEVMMKLG